MTRAIALALCAFWLAAWTPPASEPTRDAPAIELTDEAPEAEEAPCEAEPRLLLAACCKVCSKGKPCGDSCIAKDKRCTKGPGCAC